VLRVSLGCFVFFFVMFLSTVKARKVHDCRNSWHSEWWPAKLALWLGLTAVTFLAPSPLVQLYGQYLLSWPAHTFIYMLFHLSRYIYSLLILLLTIDVSAGKVAHFGAGYVSFVFFSSASRFQTSC
jgi:hypothetical protein